MHATVRLTLNIPEAGGLVWVVDCQADSSNVLQSLWREKAVTNIKAIYCLPLSPSAGGWR